MVISDENFFNQDQETTRRNDRWLCSNPTVVSRIMYTKFLAIVMVLGVASNERHIMPSYLFQQRLWVNAAVNFEVLQTFVKSWIDSVRGDRPCTVQQDSVFSHKAMTSKD